MDACSVTFSTHGFLNWLIPLDCSPDIVFLASWGSESVSTTVCFCWDLHGPEWKVTRIKDHSLESLLWWKRNGPDAAVGKGLSANSDEEEEADEGVVCTSGKVSLGGFWTVINKRPVTAFDFRGFEVGLTESHRRLSSVSSKSFCLSDSWSPVSLTCGGFYPTSAWHPDYIV